MPGRIALRSLAVVACTIVLLCWSSAARAQAVDATFDPGANQIVTALAVQPDGKIIVGGQFTGLGGVTGTTLRNRIGRLNADGTVDPTFNPGANGPVLALAVQADGKILAGGVFTSVGGGTGLTTVRQHIARFNSDGTVDLTFNPGANLNVYALAVQEDGKILVGGDFSTLGGGGTGLTTRRGIGRLDASGVVDAFDPGVSKSPGGVPIVYTIAVQADGKVLVGGYFNGLGGGTGATVRNYLGRLNADGAVDMGFNPGANSISGVTALALQADGRIVVGGSFTGLGLGTGTSPRANIGRLEVDGAVDVGFNPGAESQVLTLAVQTDGRILAGGYFKWLGDGGGPGKSTRNYIGRLTSAGAVDGTFNPGAGNVVNGVAVQGDGAVLAVGLFSTVGGGTGVATARTRLARFAPTEAAVQTLSLRGGGTAASTMAWARSGAGPEITRVTFEFSFDGSFYSLFGNGTRVAGGWQVTGVNLPLAQQLWVRARGYYGTGFQNGSGSIVESVVTRAPGTREGDFDGDGKADITIYRPSNGQWFTRNSSFGYGVGAGEWNFQWGNAGDVPIGGDFDGDGRADITVYRPSTGVWYIRYSSLGYVIGAGTWNYQWGLPGDLPIEGDFDGDGKADITVYRPSTGMWYIRYSSLGYVVGAGTWNFQWGLPGDVPIEGDFDGDGKADITVYRPSTGVWYIRYSSLGYVVGAGAWTFQWGLTGDLPIASDFDGDGKVDLAVYRPSTGYWFIRYSSQGYVVGAGNWIIQWGLGGDTAMLMDFDGDGKTDITVYRPATGQWFILYSSQGYNPATYGLYQWGLSGDVPLPPQ